jgi:hypothetical protein
MALLSPDAAFMNVPYDERYQDLYLAFIAGLTASGWIRPNSDGMEKLDPYILRNGGANLNAFVADVTFRVDAWAANQF